MVPRITEQDAPLTFGEKLTDILRFLTPLVYLLAFPFLVVIALSIPLIALYLYLHEHVLAKYYYRWTGRKSPEEKKKNRYKDLPLPLTVTSMHDVEGLCDSIRERYGLDEVDFDELYLNIVSTEPPLPELADLFFQPISYLFQDTLFLIRVELPSFQRSLCYLDTASQTLVHLDRVNLTGKPIFDSRGNTVSITFRTPFKKKVYLLDFSEETPI